MNHPESDNQIALFKAVEMMNKRFPEIKLLYANPNGGKRNVREATRMKKEGVKAGIPDLCLPVARGKYHGLYIELKVGKNTTSINQKKWLDDLNNQGYLAITCYGWEPAIRQILQYLEG